MIVNGVTTEFKEGMTVADLLNTFELEAERVVVEVNWSIIPKENYKHQELDQRDTIEIVGFVGGG